MNLKQILKLIFVFALIYALSHLLIYEWGEQVGVIFDDLLAASVMILAVIAAMSFLMFTYVDNMAKDLTELRNEVDRAKYVVAHTCFSNLKKEVIVNGALIVGAFLVERTIKSLISYAESEHLFANIWLVHTVGISLRFSCLSIAAFAALTQLLGFLITVEYRELIASNRK